MTVSGCLVQDLGSGPKKMPILGIKEETTVFSKGAPRGSGSSAGMGGSWDRQDLRNKVTMGNKVGRLVFVVIITICFK